MHYANVCILPTKNEKGRWVGITSKGEILFDFFSFDNGSDYFKEGLTRVKRNGKISFANKYGHVAIPCEYDFAWWFKNGEAKVTYSAKEVGNNYDEHKTIESDEWFFIDYVGRKLR
ncbi:MAG: WG repeat-containing protein [Flavobacteriales bacterium]|nr:WG repeat-containing protein [Flavobacteriales bacterium]